MGGAIFGATSCLADSLLGQTGGNAPAKAADIVASRLISCVASTIFLNLFCSLSFKAAVLLTAQTYLLAAITCVALAALVGSYRWVTNPRQNFTFPPYLDHLAIMVKGA